MNTYILKHLVGGKPGHSLKLELCEIDAVCVYTDTYKCLLIPIHKISIKVMGMLLDNESYDISIG